MIDWEKFWAEFDAWVDDETQPHEGLPNWWRDQKPKLQEMFEHYITEARSKL